MSRPDSFTQLDPNASATKASKGFYRAARAGLSHFKLTRVQKDALLTLMGRRGATVRLLASNQRIRAQSTAILLGQFSKLRRQTPTSSGRRFWHVSFLGPLISEYEPQIDVYAYREVVDRLLRSQQLNAVFSIELQALTNYPQKGQGRSFLLNAHALAWTDNPSFSEKDAAAAMCASSALWNEFAAPNVRFDERTCEAGAVEYLAHYLTKAPDTGKRRGKDPDHPGRWKLFPASVRKDLHLRLMEDPITFGAFGPAVGRKRRETPAASLEEWADLLECSEMPSTETTAGLRL